MLVLFLVLSAAPVKLAVPGLQTVGVDPQMAAVYVERLAVLAKQPSLSIVTARDVEQVLGLERQRQLLGCTASNCFAELAGAIGADALLSGTLARAGNSFTLVLRVLSAVDGSELVSASVRVANEDQLQDWIEANARQLGARIVARVRGEPEVAPAPSQGWLRWASLSAGVLVGAGGGLFFGLSRVAESELALASPTNVIDVVEVSSRGNAFEKTGLVMFSVGGALLITSVVLFVLHRDDQQISLLPLPGGAAFVWGGTFP